MRLPHQIFLAALSSFIAGNSRADRSTHLRVAVSGTYLAGTVGTTDFIRRASGATLKLSSGSLRFHLGLQMNDYRFDYRGEEMNFQSSLSSPSVLVGSSLEIFSSRGQRFSGELETEFEYPFLGSAGSHRLALDSLVIKTGRAEIDFTAFAKENTRFEANWYRFSAAIRLRGRLVPWLATDLTVGYEQYRFDINGWLSDRSIVLLLALNIQPRPFERQEIVSRSVVIMPGVEVGPWWRIRVGLRGVLLPLIEGKGTLLYGGTISVSRDF